MSPAIVNNTVGNITEVTYDHHLLLEAENDKQFRYQLPATMYTALLMAIGTPGNLVVLYVYFFKWRRSTSRMFILFLTALDFANCVTTLPVEIYIMRYSVMLDKPWLCKISRFCTYTFNSSSAAILVGIAVDRFRRICRPHGPQFSAQQSKFICILCIIVALLLTWPSAIFYGTRLINFGKFNGKACLLQNEYDTSILPYIYFIVMMGSTVVIFTTLSVLYYFVGIQVYRHRQQRLKRKAMRGAAQNLVDRPPQQKEETLLQDSDSSELKKLQTTTTQNGPQKNGLEQEERQIDPGQEDGLEMKPLTSEIVKNGKIESAVTKSDTDDTKSGSIKDKAEEKYYTTERKPKGFIARKTTAIRDSIIKRNGTNCGIHVKLRIGRSTLMLFLITIAYIISFLPFYTIAIIRQTYKDFVNQLSIPGYMAYHVFLRSYLLSSAINPIIYSFCNAQFRTFCFDLFRKKEVQRGVL